MKNNISFIILTFNESKHIKRCIDSILPISNKIYVVDSYSTDDTLDILSDYNSVQIIKNKFVNYSTQFNFALDNFDLDSEWIFRIDADEFLDDELINYLLYETNDIPSSISGVYFNRYIHFLGKQLSYGGMSSYWMLRMWRRGFGRCESTWMDEHIVLTSGETIKSKGKLVDKNLNNFSWWLHKHVDYSTREAIDILLKERNISTNELKGDILGGKVERTRFLKNLYNKTPLFFRPVIYFLYRYFILLGFLDGYQGFIWCVLQGFWYRFIVDAKIYEIKSTATNLNIDIFDVIRSKYKIEV